MSCKILDRQIAQAARPVAWPSVNSPHSVVVATSDTDEKSTRAEDPDVGQTAQLRQQIATLEAVRQREVRSAQESSFREGEKAGKAQAALDMEPVLERVSRALGELASLRARIRGETEKDLVALSFAIAKRVLRREVSVDPDAIQGLVKAALEKVASRDLCRVRLHPEHEKCVRTYLHGTGIENGLELIADPSLALGGVVVETRRGDLDASVDTQLSEIERGFADRLGR